MQDTDTTSPLTALVEFQVRSETTTLDQWLGVWSDRGADALAGEPETTAYGALISVQDPSHVLVFERYQHGESSIKTHVERPAHAALNQVMGERRMTKRRVMSNLFADVEDYGWWSRPEYSATLCQKGLGVSLIVTRFATEDLRQRYIQLTGEHADYCRSAEPGTLIYSGGIARRDSDRGPVIRKGDLLFVAAFADEAAALQHRDDTRHLAVQKELEQVPRERVMLQSYLTSAEGYLWKGGT